MSDVSELYPLWINTARAKARQELADRNRALASLSTIGSVYYRSVEAMRDGSQQVLDVWMSQPDTLPETIEDTP